MIRSMIAAVALALATLAGGCVQELVPITPEPRYDEILAGTTPVSDSAKRHLEGVYEVLEGKERFGDAVVLKYSGDILSVFSERNVAFMIMRGGVRDSGLVFTGSWRFAQSETTGRIELSIAPDDGGRELASGLGGARPAPVLRGASGGPNARSVLNTGLVLRWVRPVRRRIRGFWNIAHRGGGRNSDRHPYSENSIPMLVYAPHLGANGVEIDVRMTKDRVPVLFHDEELSTRLVQGSYLTGPITNYTLDELTAFARLRNGELIPTLADALDTIVRATDLTLVWLDVKDASSVPRVLDLAREYEGVARAQGRELEILLGIPDESILEAYLAADTTGVGAISELGLDETRRAGAEVWAPRWTLGTLDSEVDAMHAENRRAFVWTLDVPLFITTFLRDGDFDGILTNYPTLVAYHAYSQQ
jgi:glycerophosphoryl diester phosphodiesterase